MVGGYVLTGIVFQGVINSLVIWIYLVFYYTSHIEGKNLQLLEAARFETYHAGHQDD